MKWSKIKHSGTDGFHSECSRCDYKFKKGESAFLMCFGHGADKITEIVCKKCQVRDGLKIKE